MVTKDIRNITVRELTDKVDIHRATFYAHYKDIYDLYEQMENAVAAELNDLIIQNYEQPATYFYKVIFEYILENKQLCRMLFSTNGEGSFAVRLNDLLRKNVLKRGVRIGNILKLAKNLPIMSVIMFRGAWRLSANGLIPALHILQISC